MSNKPVITSNNVVFHEHADTSALDQAIVAHIATRLAEALATRGRASLAVSGGGTPRNMLALLAKQPLDWSRIHCLLVDERWLPAGHPDRNETMLRESLLLNEAARCRYLSIKSDDDQAEEGQGGIEEALQALPWPLDVVHLGMGTDGHTASWFFDAPQYESLKNSQQRCLAVHPCSAPHPRLSLTPAAVFDSRQILLHITGAAKRKVLKDAMREGAHYPVSMVLQQERVPVAVFWSP